MFLREAGEKECCTAVLLSSTRSTRTQGSRLLLLGAIGFVRHVETKQRHAVNWTLWGQHQSMQDEIVSQENSAEERRAAYMKPPVSSSGCWSSRLHVERTQLVNEKLCTGCGKTVDGEPNSRAAFVLKGIKKQTTVCA